jgi:hypothetical protein
MFGTGMTLGLTDVASTEVDCLLGILDRHLDWMDVRDEDGLY